MNTKQFCQLVNTTRDTLRFYDQKGLLIPQRDANNYRAYTVDDQKTFLIIRNLQLAGLKLNEIEMILNLRERPINSECHDDTLQFILEKQRAFNHKEIFYKQLQKTTATMVDSLEHSQSDLEDLINKLGDINN